VNTARRLFRGIGSVALTWGVAWGIAGALVTVALRSLKFGLPPDLPLIEAELIRAGTIFGIMGFLNGVVFAIALATRERRKSFNQLVPSRVALWGVLGGVSYPLFFTITHFFDGIPVPRDLMVAMPICALFGAASAWAMLTIARRAALSPAEENDRLMQEYEKNMSIANQPRARVER
jgi:hypothetical protein